MSNDLDIIAQLEKRIGRKLPKLGILSPVGYRLDNQGRVIRLSLYGCQLTELPQEIGQLQNLQLLFLHNNQLARLPQEIGQLQNLQLLFLHNNQLARLPQEIGQLQNLQTLGLGANQLTQLPKEIGQLQNLQTLGLGANQLTQWPQEISQLQNLRVLDLGYNQLTQWPQEIGQLQNLQGLSLSYNQLTQLPKELLQLNFEIKWSEWKLKRRFVLLMATRTGRKTILIAGNPFKTPPVEIVKQGQQAIIDYYKALEERAKPRPLNELKLLLIGDGGAGKTSLLKRLLGQPFDPNESPTHGINLNTLDLTLPASPHFSGGTVKLHCWDFGGQEIMHATHQFFLSKRSLYVLVLDSRREAKTDYWLKHIQSFGDKSPVILVINKIDENPSFDLTRQPLQKYNITHFCRLSCRTGEGLDALTQAIQQVIPQVELVQTVFPSRWWQVKTALEQLTTQGRDYLSYDHYLDLCRQHEVTNESEQQTLIDFLHDLGLVIHFDQKLLRETNIINPKWLTEAVYKLITAPQVIQQQGTLFTRQLKDLLDTRTYPSHKHDYLLELLKKFELGYAVSADTFLLPDVFPVPEPKFEFDYAHALHFVLEYDFLPKAVMSRFMVRMHQDIQDNLHWRTGVVIHDQKFDTTALIQATDTSKRLHIYVTGQQRRDYLAIILFVLRDIHHSFAKLTVKEKICLPDNPEVTVSYTHLLNLEKQGIATYTPEDSDTVYSVKDLLGTIHNPHANEAEMLSILRKLESLLGDKKTEESLLEHSNDVLKLNPNFFGIGMDVNALIKKLWKKRR